MTDQVDPKRLVAFCLTLVVLALAFVVISKATGVGMVDLAPAYMFTPLVAGLAIARFNRIPLPQIGLRLGRPRWLAASALLALPLVLLTLALAIAAPGTTFDPTADPLPGVPWPEGPAGVAAAFGLIFVLGTTVNALFALGEEVGWRGYLLWELAPLGYWKASIGIGALWGLWHAPVIIEGYNFPSHPLAGVAVMTLATMAFSPLYVYLVIRARSVLAAALLHGVFNGSAGTVLVYTATASPAIADFVTNPVGGAGIVVFALVAIVIAVVATPRLDRSFATSEQPLQHKDPTERRPRRP